VRVRNQKKNADLVQYPVAVRGLSWRYGNRQVLSDITLSFEKGKLYSIIGPNGSGKTTLLRNIAKSLEPAAGSVFLNGTDIMDLSTRDVARKLSVVPQNTYIDFDFTVLDIVLMGRNPYISRLGSESREDMAAAEHAMRLTNTWDFRGKSINEVSGGERQRALVARALAQDTAVMLLDEPVSQLDLHHQIELMDMVLSLSQDRKRTILSVMHDLNLAARYSDFLILLNGGRVVVQGTPWQVLTRENIETVYHLDSCIVNNPVTGKPFLIYAKGI